MLIRLASAEDFEGVAALLAELGRPALTPETEAAAREVFVRHIARPETASLVADDGGGRTAGFLSLEFRARLNRVRPQAWVPDLIVTEDSRGTGAGRALLHRAFELAREHGCYELTLESGWHRTVAHRFYEIAGMSRDGYYFTYPLE